MSSQATFIFILSTVISSPLAKSLQGGWPRHWQFSHYQILTGIIWAQYNNPSTHISIPSNNWYNKINECLRKQCCVLKQQSCPALRRLMIGIVETILEGCWLKSCVQPNPSNLNILVHEGRSNCRALVLVLAGCSHLKWKLTMFQPKSQPQSNLQTVKQPMLL